MVIESPTGFAGNSSRNSALSTACSEAVFGTGEILWIRTRNAHYKALGADTCVTVNTAMVSAPPNLRWFYARRLVAVKNGKSRV
jgi:hypothetical protein